MSLSNRMFTTPIQPNEDRIHSAKDDEWNQDIGVSRSGRLEDGPIIQEQSIIKSEYKSHCIQTCGGFLQ